MSTRTDISSNSPEQSAAPMQKVEIYTRDEEGSSYAAAFFPEINRIAVNGENNKEPALIAHEAWHQHNHNSGIHNLPMSLSQHHKLHIHDEISAYLVELTTVRQQYLDAKNDEERRQVLNSMTGKDNAWYFQAIARGEINPNSTNPQDIYNEQKFMMKNIQRIYSFVLQSNHPIGEAYRNDQKSMTDKNFHNAELQDLQPNDENYDRALRTMYNIGGVDYSIFIHADTDVDDLVPQSVRDADNQIAAGGSREDVEQALGLNLSKSKRRKYAAERFATAHTRKEIEQLLTSENPSKEDKKLYKAALKILDKDALLEQEKNSKKILGKETYNAPETVAIYDVTQPFTALRDNRNITRGVLEKRLKENQEALEQALIERINLGLAEAREKIYAEYAQRTANFNQYVTDKNDAPSQNETQNDGNNTADIALILQNQQER